MRLFILTLFIICNIGTAHAYTNFWPEGTGIKQSYNDIIIDLNTLCDTDSRLSCFIAGKSSLGNDVYAVYVKNPSCVETILVESGMHGNEVPPVMSSIGILHYIVDNPDFSVTKCFLVVPVHNVDGYESNLRTLSDGTDPNRNFISGWGKTGNSSPDPLTYGYRGLSPASNIETRNMLHLMRKYKPDKYVSLHTNMNTLISINLLGGEIYTYVNTQVVSDGFIAFTTTDAGNDPYGVGVNEAFYNYNIESYTFEGQFLNGTAEQNKEDFNRLISAVIGFVNKPTIYKYKQKTLVVGVI